VRTLIDSGENPPQGVIVYYSLPAELSGDVKLTILDAEGKNIKSFGPKPKADPAKPTAAEELYLPVAPGLNRFIWDMRYPDAEKLPGDVITEKSVTGALAAPGNYAVRLQVGDATLEESFEIFVNPATGVSAEAMTEQFSLWQTVNGKITQTHAAIKKLRRVRDQMKLWAENAGSAGLDAKAATALAARAKQIGEQLGEVEKELVSVDSKTAFDRLRKPIRLNAKLINLISVIGAADAAPPRQVYDVFAHLSGQVDSQLDKLDSILEESVADFNAAVKAADVPAVVV
jgi:hypothetical protein